MPDANPELSRMYAVADDHEADVLDDLQNRAGIVWTHRVEEGPGVHTWTNPVGQPCEVCGKDQAAAEEDDET